MKKLFLLLSFCSLFMWAGAKDANEGEQIHLQLCYSRSWGDLRHSAHRTPPQIPNVYYDSETKMVYFENPCFECSIELVIPGTETVAYAYSIPDGDDSIALPGFLSGVYELHVHRGNLCFGGMIELP